MVILITSTTFPVKFTNDVHSFLCNKSTYAIKQNNLPHKMFPFRWHIFGGKKQHLFSLVQTAFPTALPYQIEVHTIIRSASRRRHIIDCPTIKLRANVAPIVVNVYPAVHSSPQMVLLPWSFTVIVLCCNIICFSALRLMSNITWGVGRGQY